MGDLRRYAVDRRKCKGPGVGTSLFVQRTETRPLWIEQRGPWAYIVEDEVRRMDRANERVLENVAGPA